MIDFKNELGNLNAQNIALYAEALRNSPGLHPYLPEMTDAQVVKLHIVNLIKGDFKKKVGKQAQKDALENNNVSL